MKDVSVECQCSILLAHHCGALSGWTMNQSESMIDKTLQYLLAAEPFTLINLTNVIPFSPMNFIRGQSVIHIMKTHRNWSNVTRTNLLPQLGYRMMQVHAHGCGRVKGSKLWKIHSTSIFSHCDDVPLACQWTLHKSTLILSILLLPPLSRNYVLKCTALGICPSWHQYGHWDLSSVTTARSSFHSFKVPLSCLFFVPLQTCEQCNKPLAVARS